MRFLLVLTLAACFSPKPATGDQPDAAPDDGEVIAGCTPTGVDVCDDGIDQDCVGGDLVCKSNDKPADAIDATAGGTWSPNLQLATEDLANLENDGCNADGGRDVFYQVTLTAPQVYYVDTFGSNFDSSLRVFPGLRCSAVTSTMRPDVCSDDVCGGGQSQLAAALPVGTSCIVLDQNINQTRGDAQIRIVPGGRTGTRLLAGTRTLIGNSCGANANRSPMCQDGDGADDVGYFFPVCPNQTLRLDATTCGPGSNLGFDSVIAVRRAGGTELTCDDDAEHGAACAVASDGSRLINVSAVGPGLFWLIVDGFDDLECGRFQLDTNLR